MNPLRVVFADASFFIAAFNARDEWHARALLSQQKVITDKSQIVTNGSVTMLRHRRAVLHFGNTAIFIATKCFAS